MDENVEDLQKIFAESAKREDSYRKALEEHTESIEKYKSQLADLKLSSGDLFEKQLSYIGAGALGFSMLVIEKLFKYIQPTDYKELLITSWVCFGSTLLLNLISHLHAGYLHNKSISEIDNKNYDPNTINNRNKNINYVNYTSVAILLIGISCFIIYASKNIYTMTPEKINPTESNRGKSSTPPPQPQRMDEGKSATAAPPLLPPQTTPTPKPTDKR